MEGDIVRVCHCPYCATDVTVELAQFEDQGQLQWFGRNAARADGVPCTHLVYEATPAGFCLFENIVREMEEVYELDQY